MNLTFVRRAPDNLNAESCHKIIKAAFLIIVTTGLTGCPFDFNADTEEVLSPARQRALAVCYDVSLSAIDLPELTPLIVDSLLSLVRYPNGGQFGLTLIQASKPLAIGVRFEGETGDVAEKERLKELNNRQIAVMRTVLHSSIRERLAMRSRVFDSIELMLTFLKEPHLPDDAVRQLVVISDFIDDVREPDQRQPISVPENITAIVVGAKRHAVEKILTGPGRILHYTTVEGMLHYLSLERGYGTL